MDPQSVQPAQDIGQQVVQRIKDATNVLVTVSNNPSVDQLAAAIGFTLVLNKLKKHGTAVFSGNVPSIIKFLEPEKTLEKDTNSLRDFIIALDKGKADKLRYKIEDKYVKIFITPYRTSITGKDLEFSQGDFNVDVVIALGVKRQAELDQAIVAHGKILHDATVIAINKQSGGELGNLNLTVPDASSLSEVMVSLSQLLKGEQTELFDQQIATAFLTGIVAETDRFSNDKTTPSTMKAASVLMEAGANQQLIATKLEPPAPPPVPKPEPKLVPLVEPQPAPEIQLRAEQPKPVPIAPAPPEPAAEVAPVELAVVPEPMPANTPKPLPAAEKPQEPQATVGSDGALSIPHGDPDWSSLATDSEPEEEPIEEIHIDDQGTLKRLEELKAQQADTPAIITDGDKNRHILESSDQANALNANVEPQAGEGINLPPVEQPLLSHNRPAPDVASSEPAADSAPLTDGPAGEAGGSEDTAMQDQNSRSYLIGSNGAVPADLVPPLPDELLQAEAAPPPPVPPPITPTTQPPAGPQNIQDTAL